jgi:hypothetical protein
MNQQEKLKIIRYLPLEPLRATTSEVLKDVSRLGVLTKVTDTILAFVDFYVYNTWRLRFNRRMYLLNNALVHVDSKRFINRNH